MMWVRGYRKKRFAGQGRKKEGRRSSGLVWLKLVYIEACSPEPQRDALC
jgi:hypothetical protein